MAANALTRRRLTGTFNVCTGVAVSVEALIEELRKSTPLMLKVRPSPELERPADPKLVYGSADRLSEATGWEPRIPLSQTLADLLDFWRAKPVHGG